VIGRYKLLAKIGDGGCGVVYLAEQSEPLRRRVALKVIKLGMDTESVIARFEAERQTLALMDHPDIARVYDAGATENGRPYFVMEYVDGVPITRFADEHSLSMAARLELFARVCLALQHAHQKGIIHRDLKPSNVLVTLQDGVPVPKVIDFGIAKATQGRLADELLLTGPEQFIGTPAYMSPEQAERRDLDIDTRSDVYSLGVLLYELVAGRPPFDPKSLQQAGVDEIRRIIREVDPPRPSTRIATLTRADSTTVARLRGSAPPQLTSLLRGDLDWIVMRCLEKNRDRRYETAQELAADVRRHLRREPVVARPPSALYRTRRFVSRHRLACFSILAVVVALVAGTIISVTQAVRARRAERVAEQARADAQRRQEQAEDLLTFMLGDFRTELRARGRVMLVDAVSAKAEAYFAALDPRDLSDVNLTRHAKALTQLGEIRLDQARLTEAATAFASAYQRAALLVTRHPAKADMLYERGVAEYWIGFTERRRGNFPLAREWFLRYRDTTVIFAAAEGKTLRAQTELLAGEHNLAVLDIDRGALAAAQTALLAERALVEKMLAEEPENNQLRFRIADVDSWLGRVAEADGRYADALRQFNGATIRLQDLVTREPTVAKWSLRQAESQYYAAGVAMLLGQREEAAGLLSSAEAALKGLTSKDTQNQQWKVLFLAVQLRQCALHLAERQLDSARTLLGPMRAQLEALAAAEPLSRGYSSRLATAWTLEARLANAAVPGDGLVAAEQAIRMTEQFIKDERADLDVVLDFAQMTLLAGRIQQAGGRVADAQLSWARVVSTLSPRLATGSNDWRILDPLAQAYLLSGNTDAARPLLERLRSFGYHPSDPLAASLLGLPR
jgi:tetratricopeptide (TPR) repeat protein